VLVAFVSSIPDLVDAWASSSRDPIDGNQAICRQTKKGKAARRGFALKCHDRDARA